MWCVVRGVPDISAEASLKLLLPNIALPLIFPTIIAPEFPQGRG
jgi:hypothetical protein